MAVIPSPAFLQTNCRFYPLFGVGPALTLKRAEDIDIIGSNRMDRIAQIHYLNIEWQLNYLR